MVWIVNINSGPPCNEAQANKVGDTCMSTIQASLWHDLSSFVGAYYAIPLVVIVLMLLANKMIRNYTDARREAMR